jgi:predicted ATP-dependent endonuclease of OLD family
MNILIESLRLENFKGIKKLDIDLAGQSANISGDNATGKTTVLDAVTWLLFGKDSQGKAKFDLKTLNPDGSAINNLNHSVTGLFLVDGKRLELKKTYKENWTKKRGSVSKEFTGHVVDYMVDSVPVKEREYQTTIKGLINEESFKLLTTPDYFNSMKWQTKGLY